MFGSFLRACWLALHHQLYLGTGADIVMQSIMLISTEKGEGKAHACDMPWFQQLSLLRALQYQGKRKCLSDERSSPQRSRRGSAPIENGSGVVCGKHFD